MKIENSKLPDPLFLRRASALERLGVNDHTFDKLLDGVGLDCVYLVGGGRLIIGREAVRAAFDAGEIHSIPKALYRAEQVAALKRRFAGSSENLPTAKSAVNSPNP